MAWGSRHYTFAHVETICFGKRSPLSNTQCTFRPDHIVKCKRIHHTRPVIHTTSDVQLQKFQKINFWTSQKFLKFKNLIELICSIVSRVNIINI